MLGVSLPGSGSLTKFSDDALDGLLRALARALRVDVSGLRFVRLVVNVFDDGARRRLGGAPASSRDLAPTAAGYNAVVNVDAEAAMSALGGSASTIAAAATSALNAAATSGTLGAELASQPALAADLGVSRALLAATIPTIAAAVYEAAASPSVSPSPDAASSDESALDAGAVAAALSSSAVGGIAAALVLAALIGGSAGCIIVRRRARARAAAAETAKWAAAHGAPTKPARHRPATRTFGSHARAESEDESAGEAAHHWQGGVRPATRSPASRAADDDDSTAARSPASPAVTFFRSISPEAPAARGADSISPETPAARGAGSISPASAKRGAGSPVSLKGRGEPRDAPAVSLFRAIAAGHGQ